jgi:hypothetical protein
MLTDSQEACRRDQSVIQKLRDLVAEEKSGKEEAVRQTK